MKECGSELNTLYLANCKFVDSEVLRLLSEYCPKLAGKSDFSHIFITKVVSFTYAITTNLPSHIYALLLMMS